MKDILRDRVLVDLIDHLDIAADVLNDVLDHLIDDEDDHDSTDVVAMHNLDFALTMLGEAAKYLADLREKP
jgi:hypothetical protein